ncbi:MAG: hypothetical protein GF346_09375 [Candidatus Eisenbacteria bacterium]|nr:hypothetical protein [Candidatus Latescibacterota bacterium]MBD3302642.1 hypothetical protein [Candidatus Eisenbacteria bacterium]
MSDRNDDRNDLDRRTRELPRSIDPPRDLWPGIEARIRVRPAAEPPRRKGFPFPTWAWTGLAAAAVLILLWIGMTGRETGRPEAPVMRAPIPATVRALETQCMGAGKSLQAALQGRESRTGGVYAVGVQRDLHLLDEAIEQTREALAEHPRDAALLRMLTNRYQKKLTLLQHALRAAGEA